MDQIKCTQGPFPIDIEIMTTQNCHRNFRAALNDIKLSLYIYIIYNNAKGDSEQG
jgi:hypothetical protein